VIGGEAGRVLPLMQATNNDLCSDVSRYSDVSGETTGIVSN